MYILGISCFYHDSALSLFKDGELVFACEEERFSGIKHDSSFPSQSLKYVFEKYEIGFDDIETICFYETPKLKFNRIVNNFLRNPISSFKSSVQSITQFTKNYFEFKRSIRKFKGNVNYSIHHHSHIHYAYQTSPFDEAVILSVDGVGESDTMSLGVYKDDKMEIIPLAKYPHSIGLFYSAMTAFCGFKPNSGEYKLMGLAGFGNADKYYDKIKQLVEVDGIGIRCNMKYFNWNTSNTLMFNHKLSSLLGVSNRLPEDKIEEVYKDIASAVQRVYEEVLFQILDTIGNQYGIKNLCLSGGCAYNGKANGMITNRTPFEELWIPSAPSDAGSAIGACLDYLYKSEKVKKITTSPFLGPEFSNNEIRELLERYAWGYYYDSLLNSIIAEKLNEGKVVGWFQDRIEFGARALGNRSILANPLVDGMKDRINSIIKKREGFRPFAPMVKFDKQSKYYDDSSYVPYMNQIVNTKKKWKRKLKEVSNVDGSARIQSVTKEFNPKIYDLLNKFEELSGVPILLNTSFNVKDETMVLTPQHAIKTFENTDIDVLVLNNYVIEKWVKKH